MFGHCVCNSFFPSLFSIHVMFASLMFGHNLMLLHSHGSVCHSGLLSFLTIHVWNCQWIELFLQVKLEGHHNWLLRNTACGFVKDFQWNFDNMSDSTSDTLSDTMSDSLSDSLSDTLSDIMTNDTVRVTVRETVSHTVRDTVKNLAFDFVKNAKHHGSPTLNYTLLPLGWLDKASKEIK